MLLDYVIGEKKVVDNEVRYYPGSTTQGYVYKDSKAYKDNVGICYIPEYGFEIDEVAVEYLTEEQAKEKGYTRDDIEQLALSILGSKDYAQDIFDTVDWQHCESYAQEIEVE